jgi:hypothetical protein
VDDLDNKFKFLKQKVDNDLNEFSKQLDNVTKKQEIEFETLNKKLQDFIDIKQKEIDEKIEALQKEMNTKFKTHTTKQKEEIQNSIDELQGLKKWIRDFYTDIQKGLRQQIQSIDDIDNIVQ